MENDKKELILLPALMHQHSFALEAAKILFTMHDDGEKLTAEQLTLTLLKHYTKVLQSLSAVQSNTEPNTPDLQR